MLLTYFNEGRKVAEMICSTAGFSKKLKDCKADLLPAPAYLIRPQSRVNAHLSFPPSQSIAPLEIRRWMKHGYILLWVTNISAKAVYMEGIQAENLLARKIMFTGNTLATTVDELHPSSVILRATVKKALYEVGSIRGVAGGGQGSGEKITHEKDGVLGRWRGCTPVHSRDVSSIEESIELGHTTTIHPRHYLDISQTAARLVWAMGLL